MALATGWTMRQVEQHSTVELQAMAQAMREQATLQRMAAKRKGR